LSLLIRAHNRARCQAEILLSDLCKFPVPALHSISEQHLQRYCDEFAFRWNHRSALGIEDTERAAEAIKGAAGKRLTYRQPDRTEAADNQTE
jgi:hypothetical protein